MTCVDALGADSSGADSSGAVGTGLQHGCGSAATPHGRPAMQSFVF